MLRRNLPIYGLGGIVAPFIGIKLIDLLVVPDPRHRLKGTPHVNPSSSSSVRPTAVGRPCGCCSS